MHISRERISKLGEVFTPTHIVKDMHNLLPDKVWKDPTLIYLEPTCGNGQFVVEALKTKLKHMILEQACNTVFGMDIMQDNIDTCRLRVFEIAEKWIENSIYAGHDDFKVFIQCIIFNNIFKVSDSLEYIRQGEWGKKKFFEEDPTGNDQVLSKSEQDKWQKIALEWWQLHGK